MDEWRCNTPLDFQDALSAIVCEGLKRAGLYRVNALRINEAVFNEMIAIQHVLIAGEAEEIVDNATTYEVIGAHIRTGKG